MRRSAWIFLGAILLPSLALAWLAVRSARDQQVIVEHQQVIISQDITDALAKRVRDKVDESRTAFVRATDELLRKHSSAQSLARNFNRSLHSAWGLAEVGFAVDLKGTIYSPDPKESTLARSFRSENDRFLSNRENVEVFSQTSAKMKSKSEDVGQAQQLSVNPASQQALLNQATQMQSASPQANGGQPPPQKAQQQSKPANPAPAVQRGGDSNSTENHEPRDASQSQAGQEPVRKGQNSTANNASEKIRSGTPPPQVQQQNVQQQAPNNPDPNRPPQSENVSKIAKIQMAVPNIERQVVPQQKLGQADGGLSTAVPEESDFRRLIGSDTNGWLARFLEDKLRLEVWYRPRAGALVFGAQIGQPQLAAALGTAVDVTNLKKGLDSSTADIHRVLAILDDRGRPVALSQPDFSGDWKHPFVATEIGEVLPHWEAALYLVDPAEINRSASTLQLTLGLIVAVLMVAILLGGWMIAADVRRQMRLAEQKTDFVSNVSHELKTPLTSIRMFADMLAEGRVTERERQSNYLRIISAESARLTRLINNVLDFARMERGAPSGERRPCDLLEIVREVVDTCRPHLESVKAAISLEVQAEELPVVADRDALGQIVLNLVSNAEKYGGGQILVRVRREGNSGCVDVMDRGPGVPEKKRETIFEPFRRLDDSLSSGVSGSGLGLTLARRMARAHGGDVTYSSREGGGSCFTLCVALNQAATAKPQ